MGIKADCTQIYPLNPGLIKYCTNQKHEQLMEEYGQAISSKFDAGPDFTISDVWNFLVGIYELPANGLQYLAAQNVTTNDFFELSPDKFADPSFGLCLGAWILVILVLSALANLNG